MAGARGLGAAAARTTRASALAPVVLPDGVLVLRPPRLSDAAAWSSARLANRRWLEGAFPAREGDWEAEQTELAWVERCLRLRRAARRGEAMPFVITLDGRLLGELGVEAVDPVSGSGEASVWMVRSHGSAAVMLAASLLLVEAVFDGPRPVDRILSPVAVTSRQGRAPGLRAVGFEREATLPRRVGDQLVDHDLWVVHRTPEVVRRTSEALAGLDAGSPASTRRASTDLVQQAAGSVRLAPAVARAGVRGARRWARGRAASRRPATAPRVLRPSPEVLLRRCTAPDLEGAVGGLPPGAECWALEVDGRVGALLGHDLDPGTGITEVRVAEVAPVAASALAAGLGGVLDEVRGEVREPRSVLVRLPVGSVLGADPGPDLLADLGLERVATLRPHPSGAQTWTGEDLWQPTR